jgi:hypothetical protein
MKTENSIVPNTAPTFRKKCKCGDLIDLIAKHCKACQRERTHKQNQYRYQKSKNKCACGTLKKHTSVKCAKCARVRIGTQLCTCGKFKARSSKTCLACHRLSFFTGTNKICKTGKCMDCDAVVAQIRKWCKNHHDHHAQHDFTCEERKCY